MPVYLFVPPSILLHIANSGSRVLLPLFALKLGASPFTVGVIVSLMGLFPMLFVISVGRMIDRIGVRKPMLAGGAIVIAGLALAVVVPRLETLFLVSPLLGCGFMLFQIAVNHATGMIGLPQDRVKNFGIMAIAYSTSNFLGPLITGFAIDGFGYRASFLLLGASATAGLIAVCLRSPVVPQHAVAAAPGKRRRIVDLLKTKSMRRAFVMGALLSVSWDVFTFVIPIHGSGIGLSASQIGLILGAYGVAIFFARLLFPLVAPRVNEWRLLLVVMSCTAVMYVLFPFVHTLPLLIFFAFVLGMALGGAQPMIMTLLYNHAPAGRAGEAIGLRTLFISMSQAGVPLMFGLLGGVLGMAPVFWTMGLLLGGAVYFLRRP